MTAVLNRAATTPVDADAIMFATTYAELLSGLEAAELGLAPKPPVPILGGVLLESVDGQLTLTTFDGEVHVRVAVPTTTCTEGRLLIDLRGLLGVLGALLTGVTKKEAAGMPVEIRASTPDQPTLTVNGQQMPLTALPIQDYPEPWPALPPVVAQVPRKEWTADLERVLVAAARDDTLPNLTGVYVELGDNALTMACTDRYRLTTVQTRAHLRATDHSPSADLIPAPTLKNLMAKVAKNSTANWVLVGRDAQGAVMSFSIGNVTLATRLLDAKFPEFRQLLPAEQHGHVTVDRKALIEQVQRAAIAMKHLPHSVGSIAMFIQADGVFVRARAWERDDQVKVAALPATVVDCVVDELWFNPKYLLEGLKTFTGKTVSIFPADTTNRPVVLFDSPDGFATTNAFRYLVMPIRQAAAPPEK